MKLSEAARKGAEMHPQGFGELVQIQENDAGETQLCICFLGAVWVGLGNTAQRMSSVQENGVYEALLKLYPELARPTLFPEVNDRYETLQAVICTLNDQKKWEREKIAEWLEKQGL